MAQHILDWEKYTDGEEYTEEENEAWTIGEFMKSLIADGSDIIGCVITEYNDKGVAIRGFVITD